MIGRALVTCLGFIAALSAAAPAHAAFPGDNGRIAFVQADGSLQTVNPDGTGLIQVHPAARFPAWSPDGSRLAYVAKDPQWDDSIYTANANGTGEALVLDTGGSVSGISWSPDASRLAFSACIAGECDIYTVRVDGTGLFNVTQDADGNYSPAWSPDGSVIAFAHAPQAGPSDSEIHVIYADGAAETPLTDNEVDEGLPNWSPDGSRIVFERHLMTLFVMNADGSDQHAITTFDATSASIDPAWSPNGEEIAFEGQRQRPGGEDEGVFAVNPLTGTTRFITPIGVHFPSGGGQVDWQPLPIAGGGYPRPRSARRVQVSLVPAFAPCGAPNRMHGPPLESASCAPPQRTSAHVTIGAPDANGAAAQSVGHVRMRVLLGDPVTPADEADVFVAALLTDVRDASDLSDYAGELELQATVRITDRDNAPGSGTDATGTVSDVPLSFTVGCTPTPQPEAGSFCELETGIDSITGGAVKERQRSIWELADAEVHDGGADGDVSTEPNGLFATQGVFIP